ncbi:MAG TPA: cytochrome P450 [Roseiflexaceae bacterium]|nr:cytochrome P450 [Roseiflexaceae bacterium]
MTRGIADLPAVPLSGADITSGRLPAKLAQAAMEHGPIFKWVIADGWDRGEYVFMVGPEANRFVLHSGREHFSHDKGWTPIIGDMFGKGLLNMDDPEHARHRRLWNPAFTSAAMEAYLPILGRIIAERTAAWPQREWVDVYAEAREITFDAAAAALAGMPTGPQVDRLRELFYTMLHGFDERAETWQEYEQRWVIAQSELVRALLAVIAERRAAPAAGQPRDVVGLIVRARDEDGRALSDEQILAHLNILLVAGHETTTTLSAWTLYMLATQPEHRARIRAELAALLGQERGALPVEAVRQMKTLDNFIKEVGRIYSPVINVPRGVVRDFTFAGYTIPEGTPVRLALAASHLLPHVFADPERFDPDRFAPPREEDRRTPYSLVTFGGGPRICIGISFAQIETKALAAHVLRSFELEPLPGQRLVHEGHWTAAVPGGIRLRARPLTAER